MIASLSRWLMAVLVFLVPWVAYLGPYGLMTVNGLLAAIVATALWRQGRLGDLLRGLRGGWPFAAIAGLGLLSTLWSPDPGYTGPRAARLLAEFLTGLILLHGVWRFSPQRRGQVLLAVTFGLLTGDVILWGNLATDGAVLAPFKDQQFQIGFINEVSRGLALTAIATVPLALALARAGKAWLGLVVVVAQIVTVSLFDSESAQLALTVALIVAPLGWLAPRAGRWLMILPVLAVLLAPLAFPIDTHRPPICDHAVGNTSVIHRLEIWNFVAGKIGEAPWFGHGLEAARLLPEGRDPVGLYSCDPDGGNLTLLGTAESIPLHPHNGVLQLWLELGATGIALLCAVILLAARATWRLCRAAASEETRFARAYPLMLHLAVLAPALAVGTSGYGLWQGWWMAGLWLVAALVRAHQMPK